jgi:hypothetical protein
MEPENKTEEETEKLCPVCKKNPCECVDKSHPGKRVGIGPSEAKPMQAGVETK